ncbi:hypothetical protein D7B24_002176 [Verticillium nonalfalfae]|uniref:Enoyl reductase (ER) domain-containing protein n=1 Tax=Verticillium nonalfalfae TaxID=1051616 RepID=A0A3M9YIF5_9PEZI|nr:uncharacterized protein D7B24_002176 [Verticillium nonalfalfae]RNJ59566.1 hypothetical protein D7B24_002176 [Verticillium nonalfalfae]
MSAPQTTKGWTVEGTGSLDCLRFSENLVVPGLKANEVLVKFHAASLNYRDGHYPLPVKQSVVPGSDGAGEVVAVGSKVTRFEKGAKVITLFSQAHQSGELTPEILSSSLGGAIDGTLRQYGVFNEEGLSYMPKNLNYLEAGTLSCAALTAWNALYGVRPVGAGDWVLTQGTGGVSIAGLQFAKAAGARVIATTSSPVKAEMLKKLGADHVINYKENPNWGDEAKAISGGVKHVIEVGGMTTIKESLNAVSLGGVVTIIGWVGGSIVVGSREEFEAMIRAIEAYDIKPVIDQKVFKLEELKEACKYQWDQKHFGKVAIQIE